MQIPSFGGRKGVVAAAGALALVAAGGTAYAATGPSGGGSTGGPGPAVTPASAGPQSRPADAGRRRARPLLSRADHATIELKVRGQWVTYTLDRGKVTSVSPTSITLARPDGQSVTETLTAQTHYRGVASESGIQTGRAATVLSESGSALRVRQAPPSVGTVPAA